MWWIIGAVINTVVAMLMATLLMPATVPVALPLRTVHVSPPSPTTMGKLIVLCDYDFMNDFNLNQSISPSHVYM